MDWSPNSFDSWVPEHPGFSSQSPPSSTHGATRKTQTGPQSPACSKRQRGYFRGECSQGSKSFLAVVFSETWRGSVKASPPLHSNYKCASMTHWVWKVLMDDNNVINFQSFSSLWEEEKQAPKATSARPVPNQGHNTDTTQGRQQHRSTGGFQPPPHFSVLIVNSKVGCWLITQNFSH